MNKLLLLAGLASASAFGTPFTSIPSPDGAYLGATSYIDFSAIVDGTFLSSISDGAMTVTFDSPSERRTVTSSWATWAKAPESQRLSGETLPVAYAQGLTAVTMTLSRPASIFGFEAEPNFGVLPMKADFYDGSTLVGSISRIVNWDSGSRLFAASTDSSFDKVVFTTTADFATGAFRWAPEVPEPGTYALTAIGLAAAGFLRRHKSFINRRLGNRMIPSN